MDNDNDQVPTSPVSSAPVMDGVTPRRSIPVSDGQESSVTDPTPPAITPAETVAAATSSVSADPVTTLSEAGPVTEALEETAKPAIDSNESPTSESATVSEPVDFPDQPMEGTLSPDSADDTSPLQAHLSAPGSLEVAEPPDEHPLSPNPLAIDNSAGAIQHRTPMTPVVIAVVIGLTLIGIITFAYLKTRDTPGKNSQLKTDQPAATSQVSASDVDQTSQALDEDLGKMNDSTDFSTNDLTNATLGL